MSESAPGGIDPDRAVAVVLRRGRVLMIDRHLQHDRSADCVMCEHADGPGEGVCPGHTYTVVPGGGVEAGETPEQAAERELEEEASLTSRAERLLWTSTHNGRRAHYFLMEDVAGTAVLSGEERAEQSPRNSYTLVWLSLDELRERVVHPDDVLRHLERHLRA